MAWTQEKINETYLQVQKLAATDEEFRAELLKDPCMAIAKISDEALPENFNIKVIENDPAYAATFVLPPIVSGELIDSDLDQVAGGVCLVAGKCGAVSCGIVAGDSCSSEACAAEGNCGAVACGKQA